MKTHSILFDSIEQLNAQLENSVWNTNKNYLIQVFSTQAPETVQQYAEMLQIKYPNGVIIGQSTMNIICANQLESAGTLCLVSEFGDTTFSATRQEYSFSPKHDSAQLLNSLNLKPNTQAIISFSDQIEDGDYPIYCAFNQSDNLPPISGGQAQENRHGCWVLFGTKTYQKTCVAVALHSDSLKVWRDAYSEWNPIGMKLRVTEAQGNRIDTIEYKPAYDVYKHYLSDGHKLSFGQLVHFPLYRESGTCKGVCTVKQVLDNGSIEFDQAWEIGDEVRFCYNHPSLTVEQVRHGTERLALHQPESVFIYNCASRLDFIDGAEELKTFEGVASSHGVYCMGELYRSEQKQEILHHSMTYLAMRESSVIAKMTKFVPQNEHVISPLFSLIRNVISDLDTMNARMEYKLDKQSKKLLDSYRYDSRTGLLNRAALKEHLVHIDPDEHLLTLKLVNFTQVNEKYGYQVGDQLLCDLSQNFQSRLADVVGEKSSFRLFSIGVGEWAVMFKSNMPSYTIKAQFVQFADEIEHMNFEPYGLSDVDYLSVSLCGGLASRRDFMSDSGDEWLLKAIEARREGVRNNTHIYNANEIELGDEKRREQLGWLSCVSRAILEQKIVTFHQPIVAAHTHEVVSHECLVRIIEDDQIILPGKFLPIIEGTHLYTRLSRHMIKKTLDYMSDKNQSFSINLSPQDLMSDKTLLLLEASINNLQHPENIGLEVLESEQIKDYGRMIEVCNHFKSLGARIIVDDFGSGYSNIDEIIKLEPQVIKLDGSLIRNIDTDLKQRKIASQLVRLCQVINAKTVAEFVHNEEVCRIAEGMGVDYLQGFYLGEPSRLF